MPPKRQSFLATLERELPEPPKAATATEPAAAPPRAPKAVAKPVAKAGIRKNTLYLPDDVHDRLREISFTERRKMHDLFLEGIDHVIASRGHQERASGKKPP